MKILLIMPPYIDPAKYTDWSLDSTDYGNFPPLGLMYLASSVKKETKHEIRVLDALNNKMSHEEINDVVSEYSPDLIGLTVFTVTLLDSLKLCRNAKQINPDVHICWGGPHVHAFPKEAVKVKEVDSIIIGEAERIFPKFIETLSKNGSIEELKSVYSKKNISDNIDFSEVIEDLDSLPIPDVKDINRNIYKSTVGIEKNMMTILTSRGCPYSCTFCDVPYKQYRSRSIENIALEIQQRIDEGYRELFFYDDTFNITVDRVLQISQLIIDRKWSLTWSFRGRAKNINSEMAEIAHKAGCRQIHFGVETGNDYGLEKLKKGLTLAEIDRAFKICRKAGIRTVADFMIGLPFERTKQDVVDNIRVLKKMDPDFAQFNVFQPIPGTEIYREGIEKGVLHIDTWMEYINNPSKDFTPEIWDEYISREDLSRLLAYAYRSFYFRPKVIIRKILKIRSLSEFLRLFYGGLKLVKTK